MSDGGESKEEEDGESTPKQARMQVAALVDMRFSSATVSASNPENSLASPSRVPHGVPIHGI